MANLVVDIGNSLIKVAVFNNRQLDHTEAFTDTKPELVDALFAKHEISHSIMSDVSGKAAALETLLAERSEYIRFSAKTAAGIEMHYLTPETLGPDRLAGVIAASRLYPQKDSLIIDAGTCITYDMVDRDGRYFGGSISPGMNMRLKALNNYTGKLPLIEAPADFHEWRGNDTRSSILSGVLEGATLEVEGFIEKYNSQYSGIQVILCGGDADFFDTRLKNSIFAHSVKTEPHLVLKGLNEVIHHYND
ncbi:MAG TPA: type III pantothenate kinase [Sphingobacteriaceae bacterium]